MAQCPPSLSLDRVWITAGGGAKLLDFRAPGADLAREPLPAGEAAEFLNQIALSALEGRIVTAEEARTKVPRIPIPVHARKFLQSLREAGNLPALAAELKLLVQQRPAISRRRRLGLMAGCVIPSLIMGAFGFFGAKGFDAMQRKDPDVMRLKMALIKYEDMQRGVFPHGVDPAIGLEPQEVYIAGRYGHVLTDPGVWSSPLVVGALGAKHRELAVQIVARRGQPSDEAMAGARTALGRSVEADDELDAAPHSKRERQSQVLMWAMPMGGFIWAAFLSVAAALLFRGGVLMRALGIAVVRRDGSDASRGRMLWRACVAWSWLPLGAAAVAMLAPVTSVNTAVWLILNLLLGVVAWSALSRARSLPDRLAGTWLVPR